MTFFWLRRTRLPRDVINAGQIVGENLSRSANGSISEQIDNRRAVNVVLQREETTYGLGKAFFVVAPQNISIVAVLTHILIKIKLLILDDFNAILVKLLKEVIVINVNGQCYQLVLDFIYGGQGGLLSVLLLKSILDDVVLNAVKRLLLI